MTTPPIVDCWCRFGIAIGRSPHVLKQRSSTAVALLAVCFGFWRHPERMAGCREAKSRIVVVGEGLAKAPPLISSLHQSSQPRLHVTRSINPPVPPTATSRGSRERRGQRADGKEGKTTYAYEVDNTGPHALLSLDATAVAGYCATLLSPPLISPVVLGILGRAAKDLQSGVAPAAVIRIRPVLPPPVAAVAAFSAVAPVSPIATAVVRRRTVPPVPMPITPLPIATVSRLPTVSVAAVVPVVPIVPLTPTVTGVASVGVVVVRPVPIAAIATAIVPPVDVAGIAPGAAPSTPPTLSSVMV